MFLSATIIAFSEDSTAYTSLIGVRCAVIPDPADPPLAARSFADLTFEFSIKYTKYNYKVYSCRDVT